MATVLIVDDSSVDRELARSLLQSGSSLDVEFAEDGALALEAISRSAPDLVVTDLHMPNMNGLELVEEIHSNHASIPVVLVTGKGSEELAVLALKQGAAGYVPKAELANDLFRTAMQVLAVSRADQGLRELRAYWVETNCTFKLPTDYNLIAPQVEQLTETIDAMQLLDRTELVRVAMAVEEALSNAIYHGNLELTSEELASVGYDLADPEADTIIDTRMKSSPYKDREVSVGAQFSRTQIRIEVEDQGPGFDHAGSRSPEDVIADGTLSGRGLAKMRLFCDEVTFNERGNVVTLVKNCGP